MGETTPTTHQFDPAADDLGPAGWGAVAFTWGVWAALTVGVFVYISAFGSRHVPCLDEWPHVGESLTPSWLWAQYHEHRLPLAKLLWLGVLKLTNYNFQAGMFVTATLLSALAALLLVTARQVRGWTAYADAFFPLAVLNFGQAMTYLLWFQVNSLMAPLVASVFLVLVVWHGRAPAFRHVVGAGACLVLLTVCGPGGLPYALLLAPWLLAWAWQRWHTGGPTAPRESLIAAGLAVTAWALVGLYFVGWTLVESETKKFEAALGTPDRDKIAETVLMILAVSLGTATQSGYLYWGAGVLALGSVTAGMVAYRWVYHPAERLRALGLLLFLGTGAALIVRLAQARAIMGVDYIFLFGHYLSMVVPFLCCISFAWQLYGPRGGRGLVPISLFTALLCTFAGTMERAVMFGVGMQGGDERFLASIDSGMPLSVFTEHCLGSMPDRYSVDEVEGFLRRAHDQGDGVFPRVALDPPFMEVPVPIESATLTRVERVDDSFVGEAGGTLRFVLEKPRFVYAIRLRFTIEEAAQDDVQMTLTFGTSDPTAEEPGSETRSVGKTREGNRHTVLVKRKIDFFEIVPDVEPYRLRLAQVVLLIPEADADR